MLDRSGVSRETPRARASPCRARPRGGPAPRAARGCPPCTSASRFPASVTSQPGRCSSSSRTIPTTTGKTSSSIFALAAAAAASISRAIFARKSRSSKLVGSARAIHEDSGGLHLRALILAGHRGLERPVFASPPRSPGGRPAHHPRSRGAPMEPGRCLPRMEPKSRPISRGFVEAPSMSLFWAPSPSRVPSAPRLGLRWGPGGSPLRFDRAPSVLGRCL
jgi:hypothetical protein